MVWDELPEGWRIRKLGEVVSTTSETIQPKKYPDRLFNYVGLANIQPGTGRLIDFEPTYGKEIKSSKKSFDQRHVLYGRLRPYLNKVWLPTFDGISATDLIPLLPRSELLDRRYLVDFLRSPHFVRYSEQHMTGTKMPRLRMPALRATEIPLPPLDEQRCIVARIEELTERIDAARRLRAEAATEADAIMPSTLAEVFEEAEEEGWEVRRLGEVANPVNGFGFPKKYQGQQGLQYPFAKVSDMNLPGNEIYLSKAVNTVDDSLLKQIRAKTYPAGTVIFPKIGGAVATNKKRILATEATFDNNVMGIIPGLLLDTKWLYYYLMSIDLMTLARATTMPSIRQSAVADLDMLLPSLEEQRRIVEYLDAVQSKVEAIRCYQDGTREAIEVMRGAVLERAFRGEL